MLSIHSSSPATATNTVSATTTVTTASFTPPANSLLLILWSANSQTSVNPGSPTITDNLGTHLTYTLIDWQSRGNSPTVAGQAASWWASVTTSAAMTVTVTNGNTGGSNDQSALRVIVLTGHNTASPVGAHGKAGSTSTAAVAQSYTAQDNYGWGFLSVCDWDAKGSFTAGTGTTLVDTGTIPTTVISYCFARRTNIDDTNNATNTLNVNLAGTSLNTNWVYVEVRPQPEPVPPVLRSRKAIPRRARPIQIVPPQSDLPLPIVEVAQPRRLRGILPRRAKPGQVVPPQFNPPFPWFDVVQPRRVRGMLPRRGKQAQVVPPQFNPPFPFAEITQSRRWRGLLPRRAKPIETVPTQVVPLVYPPQTLRSRVKWYLIDRGRRSETVPPQFNPPYPWAELVQPRRARGILLRRGKQSQAVAPPQEQPVPEVVQPRRVRGLRPRRSKPIETVPPQFNPPFPFSEITQPRRLRGLLPRRAKPIEVVPTQITFTNPLFPWSIVAQVRKVRGYPVRRAKPIETVPPQVNPPFVWQEIVQPRRHRGLPRRARLAQPVLTQDGPIPEVTQPRRQRGLLARRGGQARWIAPQDAPASEVAQPRRLRGLLARRAKWVQPVPAQDSSTAEVVQPRRHRGWLPRRGKPVNPTPPQVFLGPPPFPPNLITSRRKMQRLAPRGKVWQPPWPQAIVPIPFRDLFLTFGRVSLKWVLDLAGGGLRMPAWKFNALTTKWAVGGIVVSNPDVPLSALSLEYIRVPVIATVNGNAVNPTGDTVKMAFLQGVSTQPQVTDWKAATWDVPSGMGYYFAQCLVGPGGTITLTAGTWYVWIQITDNPEIPVRQVGVIQVV